MKPQMDITIPKINEYGNTEWDCPICGHRCGDEGDITAEFISRAKQMEKK